MSDATARFDATTPIVDCNPSCSPYRYGKRRWLLWPVWSWRVAVPALPWRPLNLLQHHALAMTAHGVTRAADIGRRLDLDTYLTDLVLAELGAMGYLGPDGQPSQRGHTYLQDVEREQPELVTGLLFHDPFTGRLWPRFAIDGPRFVDLAPGKRLGGRAIVDRGTTGSPERRNCRVIWPDRDVLRPRSPSARDVLWACRTWARHHESWQGVIGASQGAWTGESESLWRFGEGRVTVLGDQPAPMFFTTFLYLPEDLQDGGSWQVADLFGMSVSRSLRQHIDELVDDGHRELSEELRALSEAALTVDARDLQELRQSRYQRARAAAVERMTQTELSGELHGRLAQLESSAMSLAAHRDSKGSASWREQQRSQNALVRRAWDACEEVMAWLTRTWADPGLAERLGRTASDNVAMLTRLAERLGFTDDEELDVLARLLMVTRGHVHGVFTHGNRHLPAMLAAALLATADDSAHPMHEAARAMPEMLVFLGRLKRERDVAAHHGPTALQDDIETWVIDGVYRACRALLPAAVDVPSARDSATGDVPPARGKTAGDVPPARGKTAADDHVWSVAHAHRLRARASQAVDRRMGLDIRRHPDLRQALIELARTREELRVLQEQRCTRDEMRGLLVDVAVVGGAAVESAFSLLFRAATPPTWVTSVLDRAQLRSSLGDQVRDVGFETGDHVDLILGVNLGRVHRAVQSGKAPLSTLVAVVVLATRDLPDHPLRAIAAGHADFLVRVARVIATRGHGDTAPDPDVALAYADEVLDLCKLIAEHVL